MHMRGRGCLGWACREEGELWERGGGGGSFGWALHGGLRSHTQEGRRRIYISEGRRGGGGRTPRTVKGSSYLGGIWGSAHPQSTLGVPRTPLPLGRSAGEVRRGVWPQPPTGSDRRVRERQHSHALKVVESPAPLKLSNRMSVFSI